MDATEYWNGRYSQSSGVEHHARQNEQIARDLSATIKGNEFLTKTLSERLLVEVGCGTGDLCNVLTDVHYNAVLGTDLSGFAIEVAKIRFPHLLFAQHNILRDPPCGSFEVVISSNVIEHFKKPSIVIDKMFRLAPTVVVVAPYAQPLGDTYEDEGGAGHVSCITLDTFKKYKVEFATMFRSDGWQHSTMGEIPMQIIAVLGEK